jgi:hypothetical protein
MLPINTPVAVQARRCFASFARNLKSTSWTFRWLQILIKKLPPLQRRASVCVRTAREEKAKTYELWKMCKVWGFSRNTAVLRSGKVCGCGAVASTWKRADKIGEGFVLEEHRSTRDRLRGRWTYRKGRSCMRWSSVLTYEGLCRRLLRF